MQPVQRELRTRDGNHSRVFQSPAWEAEPAIWPTRIRDGVIRRAGEAEERRSSERCLLMASVSLDTRIRRIGRASRTVAAELKK